MNFASRVVLDPGPGRGTARLAVVRVAKLSYRFT